MLYKTSLIFNIYILIAIALHEAVIFINVHFSTKNITKSVAHLYNVEKSNKIRMSDDNH